jgi:hypothetical protein
MKIFFCGFYKGEMNLILQIISFLTTKINSFFGFAVLRNSMTGLFNAISGRGPPRKQFQFF